jgi:predicted transcriptional regulator
MRTEQDQAFMKAYAAEVKARRAELKISQDELAARAEVNRTYIGKIELAQNQPTLRSGSQVGWRLISRE